MWLRFVRNEACGLIASAVAASLACFPALGKSAATEIPNAQSADTTSGAADVALSDYQMCGVNGGQGGLPEVRIWLKKNMVGRLNEGEHGWNYPKASPPDDMHYPSWAFWKFGVSDALLQMISEQATDGSHGAPHLGRYFSTLTNSGLTAWSETSAPVSGLEVDISDTVPITESCRADHYIAYGSGYQINFSGTARVLIKVDKQHHIVVTPISSSFPANDTKNLQLGIESLDGHPLWSFPDNAVNDNKVELIAEFTLARKPGKLKQASK